MWRRGSSVVGIFSVFDLVMLFSGCFFKEIIRNMGRVLDLKLFIVVLFLMIKNFLKLEVVEMFISRGVV